MNSTEPTNQHTARLSQQEKRRLAELKKNIIYSAAFLTPESAALLRQCFSPKFPKHFYHHATIDFRPHDIPFFVGTQYDLVVIGYVEDDRAQAVLVSNKFSKNRVPHITLSTREDTEPFYAAAMISRAIEKRTIVSSINPLTLKSVLGYFEKNGSAGGREILDPNCEFNQLQKRLKKGGG